VYNLFLGTGTNFHRGSVCKADWSGLPHSIPATAQLKMQSNGEYKNGKGIGRMQGLACINLRLELQG
jgi:hypothetical protein